MTVRWWKRLRTDYGARVSWDALLAWHRLRYQEPAGLWRALVLLSRPRAAGRVAVYFRPGPELARLYVGVPARHAPTLKRMARDFAFSVRAPVAPVAPPATPLAPTSDLPWERAFVAHIVDGRVFVDGADASGPYLPRPASATVPEWRLPPAPPAGLALRPCLNGRGASAYPAAEEGGRGCGRWPVGWGAGGRMIQAPGPVNVYGRQDAVAAWLVRLTSALLVSDATGLIVIDGAGNLVPALKRKRLVTRHLGRKVTYVNVDGPLVTGGFNPLARLQAERGAATLQRWQQWFAGMDVHPAGLELLAAAQAAGVSDLPGMQRWLARPEQQHRPIAARSLQTVVRRLLRDPHLGQWLSWPIDRFGGLPAGVLLFACADSAWGRRQLLQATLLAALQFPEARIILHGLRWKTQPAGMIMSEARLLLSNGPLLEEGVRVLARSGPQGARLLADRFLAGRPLWQETLELLRAGEGVFLGPRQQPQLTSWNEQDWDEQRALRSADIVIPQQNP